MFKKLKDSVIDCLFPKDFTCDICGVETFGSNLCGECKKTVTFIDGACCPVCGRKTVRPEICLECKHTLPQYKKAVSAFTYEGGGVKLIAKYKNGYGYLKEYFADLLVKKLALLPQVDCICYVPMTKKSLKKRGYNQVKLLADALSRRTRIPVIKDAVIKVRKTGEQKGLSRKERVENLKGSLVVNRPQDIIGKIVLVLDDVLTTGATLDEMSKALLSAGAAKVYAATVASVEYKQPNG